MGFGVFWLGLQSPGFVLLTLERVEEVNPSQRVVYVFFLIPC